MTHSDFEYFILHVLQGRCSWVNLGGKPEDEFDEEAEEEDKDEDMDKPEPEVGPPLLTPLSEDAGQLIDV